MFCLCHVFVLCVVSDDVISVARVTQRNIKKMRQKS